ncbi:MAG: c-type cytochrome, partial [Planctomycetales bacterium]|nr:c-type cytochrome [Planctomycetales bacterium]
TNGVPALSPDDELQTFQLHRDLTIELAAAEPLVESPVAIADGIAGELWVAEMYDYPSGVDGQFGPGGRIKRLTDRNHDGRFESATIFLDQLEPQHNDPSRPLPFPTGVTPWRDGILVCAAPYILFARDTNQDGRADEAHLVATGFGTDNYQARVNSLEYGLDGWLHGSCGLFGGTITTSTQPQFALGDRDFRLLPDEGIIEPATGRTQQGRVRDDAGNWFGCENGNLLFHHALNDAALRRNPHLVTSVATLSVLRGESAADLYPISQPLLFKLSGPAGRVTSGCGLGIYRDHALGDEFYGNSFTCEPVNNLVTRRVLRQSGSTWLGSRAQDEQTSEFLASTDLWFRPVQARTAVDGSLYVVDMYRYVIEHPRWIPEETLAKLDVRAGANRGRIWRIRRRQETQTTAGSTPTQSPQLDNEPATWIQQLASDNGPVRDLATQQLIWLSPSERANLIDEVGGQLSSALPLARLHAMAVLATWKQLNDDDLSRSVQDTNATVRRHAVRIASSRLATSNQLQTVVLQRVNDSDAFVRLETAYALGQLPTDDAAAGLAALLRQHADDPVLVAGVLSSLTEQHLAQVVGINFADGGATDSAASSIQHELCLLAARSNHRQAINKIVGSILSGLASPSVLLSLQHADTLLSNNHDLATMLTNDQAETLASACKLKCFSRHVTAPIRVVATRVLSHLVASKLTSLDTNANFTNLLSLDEPLEVQVAALDALNEYDEQEMTSECLERWPQLSPTVRQHLVSLLLERVSGITLLLDAVERQQLSRGDIAPAHQDQLRSHTNQVIRDRAAKLFQVLVTANRQQLIEQYAVQPNQRDQQRGKQVFTKQCATCHHVGGIGNQVGPDILIYGQKPLSALATSVLDPNQAIDPRYVSYHVELTDGRTLTGIMIGETSTGFTLVDAQAHATPVLRTDIEELASTGRSLMPEGLEQELTPQDVTDVWSWFESLVSSSP